MRVAAALHTDRLCASLTGLRVKEFESLVEQFRWNYQEYMHKEKPHRERKIGGGRRSHLPTVEEKLFFILMYMKTYPTYDVLSFIVGFHRTRACQWVLFLLPILEQTLGRAAVLPERQIRTIEEFLEQFPEVTEVFGDVTERRIQRPKNKRRQQKTYSGKKKAHTRKNVVLSDAKKRILLLTKTRSGRRHDKRLSDKDSVFVNLPEGIITWIDTGFQGIQKQHRSTYLPKKRQKNHPLSYDEKTSNAIISSIRVIIEHAIGGMKRYQSLQQPYRNKKPFMDDKLMLLAAGLWNYHLQLSA